LEQILDETYGIMIYQEQVMQIAQELAGYTLGGADLLRRAMGKKIKSEMDAQRKTFVDGASARGVPESKASDIFDQVAKFAGYGFNKSHAAGYALIAYQTAYLKANYPVEFVAASMTLDIHNTDKLNTFKQELDRVGIKLLPPDINASQAAFAVEHGAVRYALAAIKNVGEAAMAALTAERDADGPFQSLVDFATRMDSRTINKRQLENLIRAGALDTLSPNRRQMFEGAEILLRYAGAAAHERNSDQFGLFGAEENRPSDLNLPDIEDWASMDRLKEEFDAIGFYLSAHPLEAFGKALNRLRISSCADVLTGHVTGVVTMAGIVTGVKERTSAKGSRYAFVQLSDMTGAFEVIAFSETLAAFRDYAETGTAVLVKVTVQGVGEGGRITAQSVTSLENEAANATAGLLILLDGPGSASRIRDLLAREARSANGGPRGEVVLMPRIDTATEVEIRLKEKYPVSPAIARAVKAIPGVVAVTET
jgi:DNA polymerase-3 subunit alpha